MRIIGYMDSLRATASLLPTAEGGRQSAVELGGRYMPHLRVDGEQYLGVRLRSDAVSTLEPGTTGTVTVDLLYDIDYGALTIGARFEVLEGRRRVGFGQIL